MRPNSIKTGSKFLVVYGDGTRSKFAVRHFFPTKSDADGPFPKSLLRIIRADGSAALVELLPTANLKPNGDMMIGPGHSRPRYYVVAFDAHGKRDGFPVSLSTSQLDRAQQYIVR